MEKEKTYIQEKKEIYLTSSYVPSLDITIIMESIWLNGDLISDEIKGFYYGKPSKDATDMFKDKGVIVHHK
jgi:hypothetical protein